MNTPRTSFRRGAWASIGAFALASWAWGAAAPLSIAALTPVSTPVPTAVSTPGSAPTAVATPSIPPFLLVGASPNVALNALPQAMPSPPGPPPAPLGPGPNPTPAIPVDLPVPDSALPPDGKTPAPAVEPTPQASPTPAGPVWWKSHPRLMELDAADIAAPAKSADDGGH